MGDESTNSFQKKNSSTSQQTNQFGSRPFAAPVQMKSQEQQTPEELENEAFGQNKFEAFGLQLKEKSGTITPVEQERLGVLQAKMDDFWAQKKESASRSGFDFSKVSVTPSESAVPQLQPMGRLGTQGESMGGQRSHLRSPQQSLVSPIQAKLTIGEPGDQYEQEADRVASQVVEQIQAPATPQSTQGQSVQRQEEPEEELQRQPSISNLQRSPLSSEVQREAMPEEKELQAKSILQRREAIAVGEASTDLDTAINSSRGGGQPLDAGLQRSMGQAMGADFSGVRVHTDAQSDQLNQSIQAKAFTTGQDVFFRQGAYQPESRGGQELIAHELTHVVQQNSRVVQRQYADEEKQKKPTANIQNLVSPLLNPFHQPVQRLMSSENFKKETAVDMKPRTLSRIKGVDQALEAYESIAIKDISKKKDQLTKLSNKCSNYLADVKANPQRKPGINKLMRQLEQEQTVIFPLAESQTVTNLKVKFQKLSEAQDAHIRLKRQGHFMQEPDMDSWFSQWTRESKAHPAEVQQVLQEEMDKLQKIMHDPQTLPLTQQILAEVLANAPNVHLEDWLPGAKFTKSGSGITEKYTVNHNLNAPEGTTERLGSLIHELTHVSVSETFNNTPLFLAFGHSASDNQILELSKKRTNQLQELEERMENDLSFDERRKSLLRQKLRYPSKGAQGNIMRYAAVFKSELPIGLYDRIKNLSEQGLNASVIEFDTVINQIMIYMHLWEIDPKNEFYVLLRTVAQQAYEYRGAARP